MPVFDWFRDWLESRRRKATPADPLAPFAHLSVRRLEDRRVLSATIAIDLGGNVTVDVTSTSTDTVTVSVDDQGTGTTADDVLTISDLDLTTMTTTTQSYLVDDVTSLTIN